MMGTNKASGKDKCTALMLAAGLGLRMGADVPKQYLMLDGTPMFLFSIGTMKDNPCITDIIVMVFEGEVEYVRDLLEKYDCMEKVRKVVVGGKERVHSVAIGLEEIDWPCDYVFIHDCSRPFLDHDTIDRLYETVKETNACAAGVPAKDTVKIVDDNCDVVKTPKRKNVWIVQTPQVFSLDLIREAHRKALAQEEDLSRQGIVLTDDAMVAELAAGCPVRMVQSTYRNIKLTTPEDLVIGEALLADKKPHQE